MEPGDSLSTGDFRKRSGKLLDQVSKTDLETGGRFGPFTIRMRLGEGGMGVVYLAEQDLPRRMVALKLLKAPQNSEAVRRFQREVQIVGSFKHDHIVRVHMASDVDGVPYCAMEFVEGRALSNLIGPEGFPIGGPPDPRRSARIVAMAARGLEYAHGRGVLHRDVKPGNLLVCLDPRSADRCLIADFGLAREVEGTQMTRSGTILGTPQYMAPEQIRGEPEPRSDLYSLGAVLYEMLTGRRVVRSSTFSDILTEVREKEPVRPRELAPSLDADLEAICLKLLAKDPNQRYTTASDLGQDIERYLAGDAVAAMRPTARYRARKALRRRRVDVAVACVALVLGALATFVILRWSADGRSWGDAPEGDPRLGPLVDGARGDVDRASDLSLDPRSTRREIEALTADATRALDEVLASTPDDADARFLLGRARMLEGRPDLAEESWLEAIRIDEGHAGSRLALAARRVEALVAEGFREWPEGSWSGDSGPAREALGHLEVALRARDGLPEGPTREYARALAAFARDDRSETLRIARAALEQGATRTERGDLLCLVGLAGESPQGRSETFGKALELCPRHALALLGRGMTELASALRFGAGQRSQAQRALDDLLALAELRPEVPGVELAIVEARISLARLLAEGNERNLILSEASAVLSDVERTRPDEPGCAALRGAIRSAWGDFNRTFQLLDADVEKNPSSLRALFHRGVLRAFAQEHTAALADFDRMLAIDPSLLVVRSYRGATLEVLERWEEAIEDSSRVLERYPEDAVAISVRCGSRVDRALAGGVPDRRDLELARDDLDFLARNAPTWVAARARRGAARHLLGDAGGLAEIEEAVGRGQAVAASAAGLQRTSSLVDLAEAYCVRARLPGRPREERARDLDLALRAIEDALGVEGLPRQHRLEIERLQAKYQAIHR